MYVHEGDEVHSGQVLATLTSLSAASAAAEATARLASSQAQVFDAELEHAGLGQALTAQQEAQRSSATAREQATLQNVMAPAGGVVATREPQSLVNREVTTGQTLLTIVNPNRLVARLYVPVSAMEHLRTGSPVSLQLPAQFAEIHGRLGLMEGSATPLPAGLLPEQDFKGMVLPAFYTTRMPLARTSDALRPGVGGRSENFWQTA